jgi:tetratricopeptide (TPR) repeat protein
MNSIEEVKVWEDKVIIPTYEVGKPDANPMFFEKRVYQGSSGVVYPNPVVEKIFDEKVDKTYIALYLENKYIKIMVLPELGGRIQMAYDKIKKRHFIYYNQVIKPALVGLTGPWISGGIEFNWPQHHRPTTFSPIDFKIEENTDGSKTIWVNEIDQMFHTKGMAGFTLHPEKAYIEIKAKLFNRSNLPQTFLWWANPAVKVNDDYQSVFPSDVNAVFDHGKRDVSSFPIAKGTYYKVDYSPATDISRYKNIPVPTSYMAINSEYDFVGGYEHDTQAGLLHVANHHVSPGKKQWTWGNSDFGIAWDRNLTDEDGPYIELMTGMFTDNQPDFTWIMPNEEKSFTQYFLPYRELGLVKNASKDILLALDKVGDKVELKVFATSLIQNVTIQLLLSYEIILDNKTDLSPENVYSKTVKLSKNIKEENLIVLIRNHSGRELLRFEPALNKKNNLPEPAKPALKPEEIDNNEQLFLTAQHLEQYRHATYLPVPYYEKALSIDPKDIRSNNALGLWYLRRGQFKKSESYFLKAIATISERNPNPYDSEPYYNLGLCLKYLNRHDEAYKNFYKASWSNAWKDTGYFSVAQIDIYRGDFELALAHINQSLDRNANNSKAYVLKAVALRKLKNTTEAIEVLDLAIKKDPFNLAAIFEKAICHGLLNQSEKKDEILKYLIVISRSDEQNFITYAIDYAAAGLFNEALELLSLINAKKDINPLIYYYSAWLNHKLNHHQESSNWLGIAAKANSYLCFPNRLEEVNLFETAMALNPKDAKAPYYLGNLFYDKQQYQEAINYWELAIALDQSFPTAYRNLGIANFNKLKNPIKALKYFELAFSLNTDDARVLMELDQLHKKLNTSPLERLQFLETHLTVVLQRDDLYLEKISLLNFLGNYEKALDLIKQKQFHPWEGGEGKVSAQYIYSLIEIAKIHIENGQFYEAIECLESAQKYPNNLGEGKLFGTQENDIFYFLACAYEGLLQPEKAFYFLEKSTVGLAEPSAVMFYNDQQPDKIFYQGLSWQKLGKQDKANKIFTKLVNYGIEHRLDEVKIDYFAVSLPNLLIFDDDLNLRNKIHCMFIEGLGRLGLKQLENAKVLFEEILILNTEHLGAKTHLKMIK